MSSSLNSTLKRTSTRKDVPCEVRVKYFTLTTAGKGCFFPTQHVQQLSNEPGTATGVVEELQTLASFVRDLDSFPKTSLCNTESVKVRKNKAVMEMKLAHMYHSSRTDSITYVMIPLSCCLRNAGLRAFTSWIRTFRTL